MKISLKRAPNSINNFSANQIQPTIYSLAKPINMLTTFCNFPYLNIFSFFLQSLNTTYNVLTNIFKVFPQFCFGYGLIELAQQQAIQDQLAIFGSSEEVNVFDMDILGYMFVAMTVQGTFCFLLRLLINDGIIYSVK